MTMMSSQHTNNEYARLRRTLSQMPPNLLNKDENKLHQPSHDEQQQQIEHKMPHEDNRRRRTTRWGLSTSMNVPSSPPLAATAAAESDEDKSFTRDFFGRKSIRKAAASLSKRILRGDEDSDSNDSLRDPLHLPEGVLRKKSDGEVRRPAMHQNSSDDTFDCDYGNLGRRTYYQRGQQQQQQQRQQLIRQQQQPQLRQQPIRQQQQQQEQQPITLNTLQEHIERRQQENQQVNESAETQAGSNTQAVRHAPKVNWAAETAQHSQSESWIDDAMRTRSAIGEAMAEMQLNRQYDGDRHRAGPAFMQDQQQQDDWQFYREQIMRQQRETDTVRNHRQQQQNEQLYHDEDRGRRHFTGPLQNRQYQEHDDWQFYRDQNMRQQRNTSPSANQQRPQQIYHDQQLNRLQSNGSQNRQQQHQNDNYYLDQRPNRQQSNETHSRQNEAYSSQNQRHPQSSLNDRARDSLIDDILSATGARGRDGTFLSRNQVLAELGIRLDEQEEVARRQEQRQNMREQNRWRQQQNHERETTRIPDDQTWINDVMRSVKKGNISAEVLDDLMNSVSNGNCESKPPQTSLQDRNSIASWLDDALQTAQKGNFSPEVLGDLISTASKDTDGKPKQPPIQEEPSYFKDRNSIESWLADAQQSSNTCPGVLRELMESKSGSEGHDSSTRRQNSDNSRSLHHSIERDSRGPVPTHDMLNESLISVGTDSHNQSETSSSSRILGDNVLVVQRRNPKNNRRVVSPAKDIKSNQKSSRTDDEISAHDLIDQLAPGADIDSIPNDVLVALGLSKNQLRRAESSDAHAHDAKNDAHLKTPDAEVKNTPEPKISNDFTPPISNANTAKEKSNPLFRRLSTEDDEVSYVESYTDRAVSSPGYTRRSSVCNSHIGSLYANANASKSDVDTKPADSKDTAPRHNDIYRQKSSPDDEVSWIDDNHNSNNASTNQSHVRNKSEASSRIASLSSSQTELLTDNRGPIPEAEMVEEVLSGSTRRDSLAGSLKNLIKVVDNSVQNETTQASTKDFSCDVVKDEMKPSMGFTRCPLHRQNYNRNRSIHSGYASQDDLEMMVMKKRLEVLASIEQGRSEQRHDRHEKDGEDEE